MRVSVRAKAVSPDRQGPGPGPGALSRNADFLTNSVGGSEAELGDSERILASLTGLPEPTRRVPYVVALIAAGISEIVADLWMTHPPAATLTGVRLTRR